MNRLDRNFNPDVIKDMLRISEDIKEECKAEKPDGKKITEMEMNYLLKGIQLQNQTIYNRYNKKTPW